MEQGKNFEKSSVKVICEIWKPIKGFEDSYMISNKGRVKSLDRIGYQKNRYGGLSKYQYKGKIIRLNQRPNGYIIVDLHLNGNVKRCLVHRLVTEAFIENPEHKNYINHKDCILHHNNVENLEWCTQSENIKYAYDIGRKKAPHQKKVGQYDMNNNLIKIWNCLADACRELNLFESNIAKVCQGKRSHTGGYKWKYIE